MSTESTNRTSPSTSYSTSPAFLPAPSPREDISQVRQKLTRSYSSMKHCKLHSSKCYSPQTYEATKAEQWPLITSMIHLRPGEATPRDSLDDVHYSHSKVVSQQTTDAATLAPSQDLQRCGKCWWRNRACSMCVSQLLQSKGAPKGAMGTSPNSCYKSVITRSLHRSCQVTFVRLVRSQHHQLPLLK